MSSPELWHHAGQKARPHAGDCCGAKGTQWGLSPGAPHTPGRSSPPWQVWWGWSMGLMGRHFAGWVRDWPQVTAWQPSYLQNGWKKWRTCSYMLFMQTQMCGSTEFLFRWLGPPHTLFTVVFTKWSDEHTTSFIIIITAHKYLYSGILCFHVLSYQNQGWGGYCQCFLYFVMFLLFYVINFVNVWTSAVKSIFSMIWCPVSHQKSALHQPASCQWPSRKWT